MLQLLCETCRILGALKSQLCWFTELFTFSNTVLYSFHARKFLCICLSFGVISINVVMHGILTHYWLLKWLCSFFYAKYLLNFTVHNYGNSFNSQRVILTGLAFTLHSSVHNIAQYVSIHWSKFCFVLLDKDGALCTAFKRITLLSFLS